MVLEADLEVKNKKGIHARAAAAFVKTLENMNVECAVERNGQCVSGCSIMGLMMLAASKGTVIKVKFEGPEAVEAMDAIKTLMDNKFNEE